MAILRNILPLLAGSLLAGCYEDFNPEIGTKPVLCINSMITAGEPIEVEVSHTWMYGDRQAGDSHIVKDAVVSVIVNGDKVGDGYIAREGDNIVIQAESGTYGSATAEVTVPYSTPIGKVKAVPIATDVWKGVHDGLHGWMQADISFILNIEMDVDDPAGVDNYYHFGYNWHGGWSDDESDIYSASAPQKFYISHLDYNAEPIFKEHIGVFETIMGNDEDTDFVFFTDRQFQGGTYTLHLNFNSCGYRVNSPVYDESLMDCVVNLYLTTVSPSYYNWAVYKWNVDEGIIGDLADIGLAEPKWGYSNVSTGAGVVAARSSSQYTIHLKDFISHTLYPVK